MSEEKQWEYYICWVWYDEYNENNTEPSWKLRTRKEAVELQAGLRYLGNAGWELVCIRQLGQAYRERGITVGNDKWPYLYLFKRGLADCRDGRTYDPVTP